MTTAFRQDVNRDAAIIEAKMSGRPVELLAIQLGWSPDNLWVHHPRWLSRQSKAYREQVVEAVIALQDKMLAEAEVAP